MLKIKWAKLSYSCLFKVYSLVGEMEFNVIITYVIVDLKPVKEMDMGYECTWERILILATALRKASLRKSSSWIELTWIGYVYLCARAYVHGGRVCVCAFTHLQAHFRQGGTVCSGPVTEKRLDAWRFERWPACLRSWEGKRMVGGPWPCKAS